MQVRLGGLDEVAFVLGDSGQRLVLVDGVEREVDDPKRRMSTQALIDSEEQV